MLIPSGHAESLHRCSNIHVKKCRVHTDKEGMPLGNVAKANGIHEAIVMYTLVFVRLQTE